MQSLSTFMHMIFNKLRNATMIAQSKLCVGDRLLVHWHVTFCVMLVVLNHFSFLFCCVAGFKAS